MSVHVVIPARMASTRLPGKPLAEIAGVPMIVRVARQASLANVDDVVVAVDDQKVHDVVEQAGFRVMLTAVDHPSGSDRVMEVAMAQSWPDEDIVINVQGDEPLLPPEVIDQLASRMKTSTETAIATLSEPIGSANEFMDPNIVKVVIDEQGEALYFSRAPIPYPRERMANGPLSDSDIAELGAQRHVGVYGFRVGALRRFVALNDSRLEDIERLEQLRWLEAGGSMSVVQSARAIPGGVDTPEDLARVEAYLDSQASESNT